MKIILLHFSLFIFISIISSSLYSQNNLPIIIPSFGENAMVSNQDRKDYEELEQIYTDLDNNKISENSLTKRQKNLLERGDELIDINTIGPIGCSWYCGGGPRKIKASSELSPLKGFSYSANNAHDFNASTAWIEGKDDYGIGEYIDYYFLANSPPITSIKLINGYIKDSTVWKNNSRVKTLKLYLNGKAYAILSVEDTHITQVFDLNDTLQSITKGKDLVLRFEIMEAYSGSEYKDVAITEIYFDGIGVHCFAKGTMISMGDNSNKAIEDISIGDTILTYDEESNLLIVTKVKQIASQKHHNLVQLIINDSIRINLTKDHPIMTLNKGWTSLDPKSTVFYKNIESVQQLEIDDSIRILMAGEIIFGKLTSIIPIHACVDTYTITEIERGNVFFANGIMVGVESNILKNSNDLNTITH